MGLFEMLLGEEEAKKLRSAYKGRDAEIPIHMTSGDYSMAFEGHPYMQMPGARGLLEAQVQAQVPSTNQGRPQPAPEYPIPPQNIAEAVTNVDPRMEAMRQMQAMQEMQAMQAMQGIPNSAMQGFAPPMDVAAMPNSAMQGFVPMGGAY